MLDVFFVLQLKLKILDLHVFLSHELLLESYCCIIELNLLLSCFSKSLGHHATLMEAVLESKVDQSDVRVEDRLQQDAALYALNRYLSRNLLDRYVVSDLGQEVDVGLDIVCLTGLLVREELTLLITVCLLHLAVQLDHLHDVLEPFS